MRLWSISTKYLDPVGLIALWRESLLAKKVLEGNTKGYKNHPQLIRFKSLEKPVAALNKYLEYIHLESLDRKYNFDKSKFKILEFNYQIPVTQGQIEYEFKHLQSKLKTRNNKLLKNLPNDKNEIEVIPIFKIIPGEVENWEIINN